MHSPLGDIWNHLVMYENGSAVDTVLVGGEVVLRGGRCTMINEDDIYAEANEFAQQDREGNAPFLAVTRGERSVFQGLILEALQENIPVNRFARLT